MFEVFEQLMPWIVSRCSESYGCIFTSNNSTAQSIPNGTSYTDLVVSGATISAQKNIGINENTGEFTILKNGTYAALLNFSSVLSVNNITLETVLFKNGVEVQCMHMKRQFAGLSVTSHGSVDSVLKLEKGDKLKVAVRHNNSSAINLTVQYGTFSLHKI